MIDGEYSSSKAILAHELGHAEDTSKKKFEEGNENEKKPVGYENEVRLYEGYGKRDYDYYGINEE